MHRPSYPVKLTPAQRRAKRQARLQKKRLMRVARATGPYGQNPIKIAVDICEKAFSDLRTVARRLLRREPCV